MMQGGIVAQGETLRSLGFSVGALVFRVGASRVLLLHGDHGVLAPKAHAQQASDWAEVWECRLEQ